MATTPTRVRLHDFLLNPEIDERRLELVDGEVTEKPGRTWGEGAVVVNAAACLTPFGVLSLSARAVMDASSASPIPDVSFFREEPGFGNGYVMAAPNIVVDVRCREQSLHFHMRKATLYRDFGVESVWLVDPVNQTVHILEDDTERTLTSSDIIRSAAAPGFEAKVSDLFLR